MIVSGARMNTQGRVVVPVEIRRALDLEGPADLLFRLEDGRLTVETVDDAVVRVQQMVAEHVVVDGSLVDELIVERRAEVAAE